MKINMRSPNTLGIIAFATSVPLMALSIFFDYSCKTSLVGLRIGNTVHSFALFTELAWLAILLILTISGADKKLIVLSLIMIIGMISYGVLALGFLS